MKQKSKPKVDNNKINRAKAKYEWALVECKAFIENMKDNGVITSIQFLASNCGTTCVSTMKPHEALGAMECARMIILNGMQTHQSFDSLIQAMELRPDLVNRMMSAAGKVNK